MTFQHMLFRNRYANSGRYLDVQSGEVTLTGTTQTATIAAIDQSKAVVEFSYTCDSVNNDCDRQMIEVEVNSDTEIEFKRFDGTGQCVIRWFIWEARSHVPMTVYRYQENTGNSASLPQTQTITSVDTDHSFALISYRADTVDPPKQNNVVRTKITGSTTLECDMDLTNSASIPCEIQVVEHLDWDVQTFDISYSGDNASTALSPSIPEAQGYVASSGEFDQSTLDGNEVMKVWQNSDNTINYARITGSGTWLMTIYVCNTNGDFNTENKNMVISNTDTSRTASFGVTDPNKSFMKIGTPVLSFGNVDTTAPDADWLCVKAELGDGAGSDLDDEATISRISSSQDTETKTAKHELVT